MSEAFDDDLTISEQPAPQYRPFASAEEFKPFRDRWIKQRSMAGQFKVLFFNDMHAVIDRSVLPYDVLFWDWQFDDGTPCGIEVK